MRLCYFHIIGLLYIGSPILTLSFVNEWMVMLRVYNVEHEVTDKKYCVSTLLIITSNKHHIVL